MTECSQSLESLEGRVLLKLCVVSVRDLEVHEGGGMYQACAIAQVLRILCVMGLTVLRAE